MFPPIVPPSARAALVRPGRPVVYLLRGGLNIFSTGMDELTAKLRAEGVDANSVGHAQWQEIAVEARQNYVANKTPIILVGHSWGALAANLIALELRKTNTPVALMILYDPTDSVKIPPNVRHVINFISNTNYANGYRATALPGFSGTIENISEPAYNHINIDNAVPLQDLSVAAILKIRPVAVRH